MSNPNVRTICRDCIFAEKEDKKQINCSLNKLDELLEAGAHIYPMQDENDNEFFVIDNMFCMWCRNQEWGDKYPKHKWVEKARQQMEIAYQVIIWANNSLDDIRKTVESAVNQQPAPRHITVIRTLPSDLFPAQIINLLDEVCVNIKWRNQNCIDASLAIDDIVEFVDYPYYAVFSAGYEIPSELFKELDEKINDSLFRFAVIEPDKNGNGLIVPASIHKYYIGNIEQPLLQKIRDDECQNMIYPIEKLLSSYRA